MDGKIRAKWEHGKSATIRFYDKKLKWKAEQFNKKMPLADYLVPFIGDKKLISIADIGSGIFSTIGNEYKDVVIMLYPSDILAYEFADICEKRGYTPIYPIMYQDMTDLDYADKVFDIVNCVNALDHCISPFKAIREMKRICKPGGYIYLRHFQNVGEDQKYKGLHQWNISRTDNGDCLFFSKYERFLLSECVPGFLTELKKEMDYEEDDMVVSILHNL